MTYNNYSDIEDIVEDLVRIKSKKFAKGYLAQDDIAQEIRIKCYLSFGNFVASRGKSLKTYLNVCTENHLRNLIRDKFAKFDPPCRGRGCKHYDQNGQPTADARNCESFVKYMEKYIRKCNSRMPCSIDEEWLNSNEHVVSESEIDAIDLHISIKEALKGEFPENYQTMLKYYENMLMGKKVLKTHRIKIQDVVSRLIGEV